VSEPEVEEQNVPPENFAKPLKVRLSLLKKEGIDEWEEFKCYL
jgi:hypothetical protein